VLRIYVGFYMLSQGWRKFQRDFAKGDWIGRQIGDLAMLNLLPWYRKFLAGYVVPHHELFGWLVVIGEIAVGGCLLVGFLSRWSALVGLFMLINYYLGVGMVRGGATSAQQQTFIILLAIFVLASPGRTLGLDGLLFGSRRGKSA
jgi:uncharacterized membrane protein YphA (DoxX/SURF4 family)